MQLACLEQNFFLSLKVVHEDGPSPCTSLFDVGRTHMGGR